MVGNEPDLFVIGGGPAGLATAIAARRRGLRVVVADGAGPNIDKACGEGLMPDSRRAAAELGIDLPESIGHKFRGIRFLGATKQIKADFPDGCGIGIRRTALHRALVRTAEDAGVELRWHTPVAGLDDTKARWIVGADGNSSRVRRWAGLEASLWRTRRYAYRRHFAVAPWTEYMELYWGDGCQIYVTPVGDCEVCVALISHTPALRITEALERRFPALNARLAGMATTSLERGAVTVTTRLRAVAKGNVALIGDASGSVDAITGEGLCLIFKQATSLADAIAKGNLAGYNRAHPWLSLRPNLMGQAMLTMDRAALIRDAALGAMSAQPWIFQKLLDLHVA